MPIYNVEKYIHNLLISLEKNLCPEVEVILVDDGTLDSSGKIADDFAIKFSDRVKVIHKNNGGLSSARNVGIKEAVGEYVICFDSDDYITDDSIKQILNSIDNYNNPDMIIFDMYIGSEERGFLRNDVPYLKSGLIAKKDFLNELSKNKGINSSVACKVIKKSFFNKVLFNESTRFAEDYEFITNVVPFMERIVYVKTPIYYYVMRNDSITHTATINNLTDYYRLVKQRYEKFSELYEGMSIYGLVVAALSVLINSYKNNTNVYVDECEDIIKKRIGMLLVSSEYNMNEKKKFLLIYFGLGKYYYSYK